MVSVPSGRTSGNDLVTAASCALVRALPLVQIRDDVRGRETLLNALETAARNSTETGKAIEILARGHTTAEKTSESVVRSKFRDHKSVTIGWRNHLRATRVREPAGSIVCRCTAELAPPTSPFCLQIQQTSVSVLLTARHLPTKVWCGAEPRLTPVSYTHLTLPTILRV